MFDYLFINYLFNLSTTVGIDVKFIPSLNEFFIEYLCVANSSAS